MPADTREQLELDIGPWRFNSHVTKTIDPWFSHLSKAALGLDDVRNSL